MSQCCALNLIVPFSQLKGLNNLKKYFFKNDLGQWRQSIKRYFEIIYHKPILGSHLKAEKSSPEATKTWIIHISVDLGQKPKICTLPFVHSCHERWNFSCYWSKTLCCSYPRNLFKAVYFLFYRAHTQYACAIIPASFPTVILTQTPTFWPPVHYMEWSILLLIFFYTCWMRAFHVQLDFSSPFIINDVQYYETPPHLCKFKKWALHL